MTPELDPPDPVPPPLALLPPVGLTTAPLAVVCSTVTVPGASPHDHDVKASACVPVGWRAWVTQAVGHDRIRPMLE